MTEPLLSPGWLGPLHSEAPAKVRAAVRRRPAGTWFAACIVVCLTAACVSPSPVVARPPVSSATLKAERAAKLHARITAAVRSGDDKALRRTARALSRQRLSHEAVEFLLADLSAHATPPLSAREVRSAAELYLCLPESDPALLFKTLVASTRLEVRRTGWQVATAHPSAAMGEAVSDELSQRAEGAFGDGEKVLSPEAALAVRANGLKDAYPLLRVALTAEGRPAYARAMMDLEPERAAEDLLGFLATAVPAALLTGDIPRYRRVTYMLALEHFRSHPPQLHHPGLKHLFYFAASHDLELAEAAVAVLSGYTAGSAKDVAFLLAQTPPEVQHLVIERLSRRGDPALATLTDALRALGF